MKATFECYDALGTLMPKEERDIVTSFNCEADNYAVGVWVKGEGTEVIPLYLTQAQVDELKHEWGAT